MTLSPATVTAGQTSQGTVTLDNPAPSGGAVVTPTSGNTSVATVPASVTVAAGARSATFSVATRAVSASTSVNVSAAHNGAARAAVLTVNPATAADTVGIQRADYATGKRELRVEASSSRSTATLRVYVTSTGALIGTLSNNGGGRYSGTFRNLANPQNVTVRSSLGGSATRAVAVR